MSCLKPYRLKTGEDVPCGKCPICLKRRASGWAFRLMEEDKWAKSAHFVTFTYDPQVVPMTRNQYMTLCKRDMQLYFKRLRKLHGKAVRIKYYVAGEYGGKTFRPHYHAIIFNADMEKIGSAWTLDGQVLGHVHIDQVTGASINYTIKYMCKTSRIPLHENDDRQPEFSHMSKGLGSSYVNQASRKYHRVIQDGKLDVDNSRMFLVMPGGYKVAMPRYYKNKLFDEFDRMMVAWKAGEKARQEYFDNIGNDQYFRDHDQAAQAAFRRLGGRGDSRDKM